MAVIRTTRQQKVGRFALRYLGFLAERTSPGGPIAAVRSQHCYANCSRSDLHSWRPLIRTELGPATVRRRDLRGFLAPRTIESQPFENELPGHFANRRLELITAAGASSSFRSGPRQLHSRFESLVYFCIAARRTFDSFAMTRSRWASITGDRSTLIAGRLWKFRQRST
jgi:hypothetical protein